MLLWFAIFLPLLSSLLLPISSSESFLSLSNISISLCIVYCCILTKCGPFFLHFPNFSPFAPLHVFFFYVVQISYFFLGIQHLAKVLQATISLSNSSPHNKYNVLHESHLFLNLHNLISSPLYEILGYQHTPNCIV